MDRNKRILEIGPLANPMISKTPGQNNVFYADIRPTEAIKDLYKNDNSVDKDRIVDIDYVITDSYSNSLKDIEPFDYILMSHVIEHIPEIIKFFLDISKVLKNDGKVCLTIPDKRYCFDHYRCPTSFAECYDVYRRGMPNNPLRVLDFCSGYTINDPVFWWNNPTNYEHIAQDDSRFTDALSNYNAALHGDYIDVHFSVFTPETFLLLVYNLTRFSLFPFVVVEFYGTEENTFEFNVVLQNNTSLISAYYGGVINDYAQVDKDTIYKQLLVLLANNSDSKIFEHNIILKETLSQLENKLSQLENKLSQSENKMKAKDEERQHLQQQLDAVFMSRSWRVTKPLRCISRFARNVYEKCRHSI
jgi:SAM-dependent methyltransferase